MVKSYVVADFPSIHNLFECGGLILHYVTCKTSNPSEFDIPANCYLVGRNLAAKLYSVSRG